MSISCILCESGHKYVHPEIDISQQSPDYKAHASNMAHDTISENLDFQMMQIHIQQLGPCPSFKICQLYSLYIQI